MGFFGSKTFKLQNYILDAFDSQMSLAEISLFVEIDPIIFSFLGKRHLLSFIVAISKRKKPFIVSAIGRKVALLYKNLFFFPLNNIFPRLEF